MNYTIDNFGFIISAYRQVDLTRQNVESIRQFKQLGHCPIVVISTCHEDIGFADIPGIEFIHFKDAPGNPNSPYKTVPWDGYIEGNWHHEYLPQRILRSIALGAAYLNDRGIQYGLHCHSDTFWKDENLLVNEISRMHDESLLAIGDLSISIENIKRNPPGCAFNPEGMLFDLDFAETIDSAVDHHDADGFKSNGYGTTEWLIGQYLHYYISGKNLLNYTDEICDGYKKKVKVRCTREYHGDFGHLINLWGKQ